MMGMDDDDDDKMGSMIGHRIYYNGVEALRDQRHIPSRINPSTPVLLREESSLIFLDKSP